MDGKAARRRSSSGCCIARSSTQPLKRLTRKPAVRLAILMYLPIKSLFTRVAKSQVQVDIFHRTIELRGEVVAQPFRIQTRVEITLRGDKSSARFRHFLTADGQKAVREHIGRRAET